jgi:alpha-N-arabinofuranosidase
MVVFRPRRVVCWLAVGAVAAGSVMRAQITVDRASPRTVTIAVDSKGNQGTVPDEIFGSFLEPIDDSINHGVNAEILVNGSLEAGLWNHASLEAMFRDEPELVTSMNETGIPIPWQPANAAAGNRYELHVGDAANSWQSLEIMGVPGQLTGIEQRVYLPVQRTLTYDVSLYAKHYSGPGTVTASLRSVGTGKVLASATVEASASAWNKLTGRLTLPEGAVRRLEAVDFAVTVEGDARVAVDEISLMPADAVGTLDPDVLKMAAAMKMTELRFGGNFSSYYHWRDGIGPLDKRVTTENIAWGIPEYNTFGTDEFLKFCELVKAVPQFNVNMGSGSPEEAADWVRYVRERYKGPLIVEMGNELYGKWQVGYPTVEELPGRTLAFSKALRAVDPKATLIGTGSGPVSFERWNAAQLSNPPGTFDLLSVHLITGTNHVVMRSPTPDFMAAAAYAVPFGVGGNFDRMQAQVDAVPGYRGKLHFAVTEWLYNSKGDGERNFTNESPSSRNEGGAVMIASTFHTFFRHNQEIKLVDMTGMMAFAGIWKRKEQVFATPAYYAFRMYAGVKGQTVLPVTSDSGSYSVGQGTQGYAEIAGVPYVDAVATRSADGKTITVFCVNRSLTEDLETKVRVVGFRAGAMAETEQIRANSRYEMNDEYEAQHIVPIPGSAKVQADGTMSLTLPHESVTRIELRSH